MNIPSLVAQARTCRRFDNAKALPEGCLELLVDCARLTPSGRNQQVLRYALVEGREAVSAMVKTSSWAGALKWDGPEETQYPGGYVVICAPEGAGPLTAIDLGIAAQTINLAANDMGLRTCMFKSYKPDQVAAIVPVPAGFQVMLTIAMGWPGEACELRPMPDDGNVDYWREGELHCVPKRSLNDLIFARL